MIYLFVLSIDVLKLLNYFFMLLDLRFTGYNLFLNYEWLTIVNFNYFFIKNNEKNLQLLILKICLCFCFFNVLLLFYKLLLNYAFLFTKNKKYFYGVISHHIG